jgi:hypothetical protein
VILGGPGGDTVPRVLRGTTSRAEVVLVESYATAKGLVSGELTTGDAIAAGLIKVRGNAGRLVASRELLTRFGDALAGLAPDTTF